MNSISKSDIDKSLGKILRAYRVKAGMTQEQLSEQLEISLKYISRIENGNNGIKTQTLIKYINILGICPNTLYSDFIINPEIKKDLELSQKINTLSSEKKDFIFSIVDLLSNL